MQLLHSRRHASASIASSSGPSVLSSATGIHNEVLSMKNVLRGIGRGILLATAVIHIYLLHLVSTKNDPFLFGEWFNKGDNVVPSSSSFEYIPSSSEELIIQSVDALGYSSRNNPSGCDIWKANTTHGEIYNALTNYAQDLSEYNKAVTNFEPIPDVFPSIKKGDYSVCETTKIHTDGVSGLFPSNQLSYTKSSGYVEPLTPPMRSHVFCTDSSKDARMSLDYLVHDYYTMCRNLKPTSTRVLIDMGASLSFHKGDGGGPMLRLLSEYEKFGFHFDHYYAFEITFTEPKKVFEELLPEKYFPIYHWINTGVSHEEGSKMNPLHSILSSFNEDDFIVMKLDIDTGSIELPLVKQLLDGGENGIYHKLIDQFYFEHHVHMKEIAKNWKSTMKGTIKDSLDIFYGLRQKGIPAHFWP